MHVGIDAGQTRPHDPQLFASEVVSTQAVGLMVGHAVNPAVVHVPPQFVPSQVAAPPLGMGHWPHDVPHDDVSELLTHPPLHTCDPAGHAHTEA